MPKSKSKTENNILVTGGAGFIGSHACKLLARAGYNPVIVDNLSRGFRSAAKWGVFEQGDICDLAWLGGIMLKYKPLAVLHFAGLIDVAESFLYPEIYHRNNVEGTLCLLDAMRSAGVNKLVFSSSCAVHGHVSQSPISEDFSCQPINPYGESKLECEKLIADAVHKFGLNAFILRYFNAAGNDPDCEIGEMHEPETHLIPLAVRAAITGGELNIFGNDYPTPDGTAIRDYIHVCDLADAHIAALQHLLAKPAFMTLNLGSGSGVSVRQIIDKVEQISEKIIAVNYLPRRQGDSPILVSDTKQSLQYLGFEAKYSDIDNIIRNVLAWQRSNNSLQPL